MSIFKIEVGTWELEGYYVIKHDKNTIKEFYDDYKNIINEHFDDIIKCHRLVYNWSNELLMYIKPYLEKIGYEFMELESVGFGSRFDSSILTENNKILFENKIIQDKEKEADKYKKTLENIEDLPF